MVVLAIATLLLSAVGADAKTTVKRTSVNGTMTLSIVGDAGEEHDVMVEFDDEENLYYVTDDSATLDASSGCTGRPADMMVVCPPGSPRVGLITVTTAEREDSVLLDLEAGERSVVSTGTGDDFIKGLEGRDEIDAGAGSDVVDAADGNDVVIGGAGDDVLDGGYDNDFIDGGGDDDSLNGDLGSDYIGGGAGIDTVDYAGYKAPLTVDLDGNADDGLAAEHDNVATDIENIKGGSSSDVLTGSAGSNTISGGDGDDVINVRDGSADLVSCGKGSDVAVIDSSDKTDRCESLDRGMASGSPAGFKIKIAACGSSKIKDKACVEVSCPGARGACKGNVALEAISRAAGKSKKRKRKTTTVKLGSSNFEATGSRASKVSVKLSKQGLKLLRKSGKLTATVKVDVKDGAGLREGHTGSLKLAQAKRAKRRG